MPYTAERQQNTRAHLLEATGALAKKNGFAATGVDDLMAAAGLTSGAFYSRFRSKSELLEAIVEHELKRSLELFSSKSPQEVLAVLQGYLSLSHVAHPESGCVVPSLTAELARADNKTRLAFEQGITQVKDEIARLLGDEGQAWAILAQIVGAVMMARAMSNQDTQRMLLRAVLRDVKRVFEISEDRERTGGSTNSPEDKRRR